MQQWEMYIGTLRVQRIGLIIQLLPVEGWRFEKNNKETQER